MRTHNQAYLDHPACQAFEREIAAIGLEWEERPAKVDSNKLRAALDDRHMVATDERRIALAADGLQIEDGWRGHDPYEDVVSMEEIH